MAEQGGLGSGAQAQSLARLEAKAKRLAAELGVPHTTTEAAREDMLAQGFTAEIPTSPSAFKAAGGATSPSSVILHVEGSQSKEPINVNIYMPGTGGHVTAMHNVAQDNTAETKRIEKALQDQDKKIDRLIQTSERGDGSTQLHQHYSSSVVARQESLAAGKPGRLESLALRSLRDEHAGSDEAAIQAEIQSTLKQISQRLAAKNRKASAMTVGDLSHQPADKGQAALRVGESGKSKAVSRNDRYEKVSYSTSLAGLQGAAELNEINKVKTAAVPKQI